MKREKPHGDYISISILIAFLSTNNNNAAMGYIIHDDNGNMTEALALRFGLQKAIQIRF